MIIIEAVRSKRAFRRVTWKETLWFEWVGKGGIRCLSTGTVYQLAKEDIFARDYLLRDVEVKPVAEQLLLPPPATVAPVAPRNRVAAYFEDVLGIKL